MPTIVHKGKLKVGLNVGLIYITRHNTFNYNVLFGKMVAEEGLEPPTRGL